MSTQDEIIEATERAWTKWTALENENVTYLGKLISDELKKETPEQKLAKIKKKEDAFRMVVSTYKNGYPEIMLEKFCNYWTEKNCRGKMRYEFEKTFEISKRLATWASRDKDINKKPPEPDCITFKEMIDRFNKGETAIQEQYEPVTPGDKRTLWKRK